MRKRNAAGLLAFCLCLLLSGCQEQARPEPAGELPQKAMTQESRGQETKAIAPGEGAQGARVEFVTRQHSMERIQFTGGYLRNLPEEKPETILRQAPDGARGMIFGKREINGLEWAKVATRDGITGWYTVPARPGASATTKRENLKISKDAYETTYPQVTGEVTPQAQDRINQELGNYIGVFRYMTGPVGSALQCQVTYNRNNLLSIVFTAPPILYRMFPVSEVNNLASWARLKKYAYVSPLQGGADPTLLRAEKIDLQYALVFDLTTGKRLTLNHFLGNGQREALQARVEELGPGTRLQPDNFYITDQGQLLALVDLQGPGPGGRKPLDLSDLVIKEF